MGLVYAEIELIRGADIVLFQEGQLSADRIRQLKVNALVDSGAYMLAINQQIKTQLDLRKVGIEPEQIETVRTGLLIPENSKQARLITLFY